MSSAWRVAAVVGGQTQTQTHVVCQAELFQLAQPLELGRVYYLHTLVRQVKVACAWVCGAQGRRVQRDDACPARRQRIRCAGGSAML